MSRLHVNDLVVCVNSYGRMDQLNAGFTYVVSGVSGDRVTIDHVRGTNMPSRIAGDFSADRFVTIGLSETIRLDIQNALIFNQISKPLFVGEDVLNVDDGRIYTVAETNNLSTRLKSLNGNNRVYSTNRLVSVVTVLFYFKKYTLANKLEKYYKRKAEEKANSVRVFDGFDMLKDLYYKIENDRSWVSERGVGKYWNPLGMSTSTFYKITFVKELFGPHKDNVLKKHTQPVVENKPVLSKATYTPILPVSTSVNHGTDEFPQYRLYQGNYTNSYYKEDRSGGIEKCEPGIGKYWVKLTETGFSFNDKTLYKELFGTHKANVIRKHTAPQYRVKVDRSAFSFPDVIPPVTTPIKATTVVPMTARISDGLNITVDTAYQSVIEKVLLISLLPKELQTSAKKIDVFTADVSVYAAPGAFPVVRLGDTYYIYYGLTWHTSKRDWTNIDGYDSSVKQPVLLKFADAVKFLSTTFPNKKVV